MSWVFLSWSYNLTDGFSCRWQWFLRLLWPVQPQDRILPLFLATRCLRAPHAAVRGEGWSFSDDHGCSTGQDVGRVCDSNTTRVSAASLTLCLAPLLPKKGASEPQGVGTEVKGRHQGDWFVRLLRPRGSQGRWGEEEGTALAWEDQVGLILGDEAGQLAKILWCPLPTSSSGT